MMRELADILPAIFLDGNVTITSQDLIQSFSLQTVTIKGAEGRCPTDAEDKWLLLFAWFLCSAGNVWLLLFVLDWRLSEVKIPRNYRKFENQQLYEHTKYHPTDGIFYRRKKSF